MRLYVVSDLHIRGSQDPHYRSLLELMRERVRPGDCLVLAGDIFDLFVGNKEIFLRRYSEFMQALERLDREGIEAHYIEGNHDFLIRGAFARFPNLKIHSRSFELRIKGKRFYLAHGDLVDSSDYGYRALRGFLRSPIIQVAAAVAPGSLVDRIGQASSIASSRRHRPRSLERLEEVRRTYRNFAAERIKEGFDFVVMGHCHDLDEMHFTIDGRRGQYVNVGYPREHGSLLTWSPGEEAITREPIPEPRPWPQPEAR